MQFSEISDEDYEEWEAERLAAMPEGITEDDLYEERCEECGGKVWVIGGHGYYNGSYDCYTLYLECENCGPYEVECV